MRENMKPFYGRRITVQGVFGHYGKYNQVKTALFQALEHDGEFLCSHTYVQHADTMIAYDLRFGERVQFSAWVIQYRKNGKCGSVIDYGLTHPMSVKTLDRKVVLPSLIVDDEDLIWKSPQARMNRTDLATALEKLAFDAGGYEQIQAALNFLRES